MGTAPQRCPASPGDKRNLQHGQQQWGGHSIDTKRVRGDLLQILHREASEQLGSCVWLGSTSSISSCAGTARCTARKELSSAMQLPPTFLNCAIKDRTEPTKKFFSTFLSEIMHVAVTTPLLSTKERLGPHQMCKAR